MGIIQTIVSLDVGVWEVDPMPFSDTPKSDIVGYVSHKVFLMSTKSH